MEKKPRYKLSREEREAAALARLKRKDRGMPSETQRLSSGGGPPSGRDEFGEHIVYATDDAATAPNESSVSSGENANKPLQNKKLQQLGDGDADVVGRLGANTKREIADRVVGCAQSTGTVNERGVGGAYLYLCTAGHAKATAEEEQLPDMDGASSKNSSRFGVTVDEDGAESEEARGPGSGSLGFDNSHAPLILDRECNISKRPRQKAGAAAATSAAADEDVEAVSAEEALMRAMGLPVALGAAETPPGGGGAPGEVHGHGW